MSDILIIVGHPLQTSLCQSLADHYQAAAHTSGAQVDRLEIASLLFNPDQLVRVDHALTLEPDLQQAQAKIKAAQHLVWIYPNWWGSYPAKLKGFIDRVFIPGFAYKYRAGNPFPEQLLKGKTARLIVTMDGPGWWYRYVQGAGGDRAMRNSILKFCGIKTVGTYAADQLRPKDEQRVARHLARATALGTQDGQRYRQTAGTVALLRS